jgi:hypothetical protein
VRYPLIATVVAVAVLAIALASGATYRRGALVGAAIASLTALASLFAMARSARRPGSELKGPLVVMVVAFLVRIVLVAIGAALVSRAGEHVIAFIVAFFVPYFAFSTIEAAFLHSLRRSPGSTA